MSNNRHDNVKIPILKTNEYPTWRVKMLLHLRAMDPDYLDRINDGPYIPSTLVPRTDTVPEHYVPKPRGEWSAEEYNQWQKDARVMNILHNGLDPVMSNRVIACRTAKEIWDTLETQCQGTEAIKRNRRNILTQEYEQFDARPDESLTDLYDRFLILLNNLSLVGKEYEPEEFNFKFLQALSEEWRTEASIIRHQYNLHELTLGEVYGMLRTHDLEIEQHKNKRGNKGKSVALKAEAKPRRKAMKVSVNKYKHGESDSDDSNDDSDAKSDGGSTDPDMMEMVAMIVKGFKKMKFKRERKQSGLQKKFFNAEKDRHNKREGKGNRFDKSKLRCFNCDGLGHIASECKKGKTNALITSSKSWMDSSDSEEEEENYALMAFTEDSVAPDVKVPPVVFDLDTDNISQLKSSIKSLHMSFKCQTLENARIKSEMSEVRKRNEFLEAELLLMEEVKTECNRARHNEDELRTRVASLEKDLATERKILATWTETGNKLQELSINNSWNRDEGLGYKTEAERKNKQKDVIDELGSPKFYKQEVDNSKTKLRPVNFVYEKKISNSITEKGSSSQSKEQTVRSAKSVNIEVSVPKPVKEKVLKPVKSKGKNIGLLSNKQLKKKISEATNKKFEPTVKRNRNGKVGINKHNNFKYIPNAPRKTCFNCGNSNHLAIDCRKSKKKAPVIPNSDVRNRSIGFKPENPCFHCGSKWHSIYVCEEYHSLYHNSYEPLPKFNKVSSSVKSVNVKHACNISDTDKANSDKSNSDRTAFVKKTSAVKNVKLHANRTQQVWVLKNPN
jgi:gag-polypeptide of LTR copia-type/Zinc knuckle